MPDLTSKLGIKKPHGNEYVKREMFNENWDIIDENSASQSQLDTHESDTTVHITQQEREQWNETEANAKAYTDQLSDTMHFQRNCLILGNNDWTSLVYDTDMSKIAYDPEQQGGIVKDETAVLIRTRIPIDPESTYYARVKVKKLSGNGTFYCGAASLDSDFNAIMKDQATNYNYFAALAATPPVNNTMTYEGTIKGYNIENEADHHKFDPNAAYFDVVIVCNYLNDGTGTGQTLIESLEVYKAPNTLYVGDARVQTKKTIDFVVEGDANTYYPVVFEGVEFTENTRKHRLDIYRSYGWQAPSSWYPDSTNHFAGLNLIIDQMLIGWSGASYEMDVTIGQTFETTVADIICSRPDTSVVIVWMRGGGAAYQISSTSPNIKVEIYYDKYERNPRTDLPEYNTTYYPKTEVNDRLKISEDGISTGILTRFNSSANHYIGGGIRAPLKGNKVLTQADMGEWGFSPNKDFQYFGKNALAVKDLAVEEKLVINQNNDFSHGVEVEGTLTNNGDKVLTEGTLKIDSDGNLKFYNGQNWKTVRYY
ncbi:hypothetical protein [Longirhabdus pacifica]|uniref:hypothetical protein n=1 Tax=Longirhabdus pacifica TaxID=2305227 RepID=UPI001008D9AB|nr:hypothetical protein [Longirhabdus pacifica]